MKTVYNDLIFVDLEASSSSEVIDTLSAKLLEKGFVKETFASAVKEREASFPTGLPTEPYGVAIPHTEQEHVNQTALAFAKLKDEVIFKSILNDGSEVKTKFVFLLASCDSDGHMAFMRNIMTAFQSEEIQNQLYLATSTDRVYELLKFIDEENG